MSAASIATPGSKQQETHPQSELQTEQQDIASLAYALWQRRGCPEGSPDQDWKEAEQTFQEQQRQATAAASR